MRINGKPLKRAQRPAPLLSPLGVGKGGRTRPAVRTCGPPRQGGSQRGPRPRARGAVACALSASCHCRSQCPAWLGPPHLVRENVGCREYRECQSLQTPLPARPYTLLRRGDPRRTTPPTLGERERAGAARASEIRRDMAPPLASALGSSLQLPGLPRGEWLHPQTQF